MESGQRQRLFARWTAALLAALAGLAAYWALRPQPERSRLGLVEVAVPAGWRALPIAARAGPEVEETHKDSIAHQRPLGRFTVRWAQVYYDDHSHLIDTRRWTVSDPDLAGELEGGPMPCGAAPDELRHDAASEVWVLAREREEGACAAFQMGKVVDEPAFELGLGSRLRWSALAAALVLAGALAFGAARRAADA